MFKAVVRARTLRDYGVAQTESGNWYGARFGRSR